MLSNIDKNHNGKIELEEVEEVVEEAGSCFGSSVFRFLFQYLFGCFFKKREPDKDD